MPEATHPKYLRARPHSLDFLFNHIKKFPDPRQVLLLTTIASQSLLRLSDSLQIRWRVLCLSPTHFFSHSVQLSSWVTFQCHLESLSNTFASKLSFFSLFWLQWFFPHFTTVIGSHTHILILLSLGNFSHLKIGILRYHKPNFFLLISLFPTPFVFLKS